MARVSLLGTLIVMQSVLLTVIHWSLLGIGVRVFNITRGVQFLQIRKYQRSTDLLIKKAPFSRLVREISAPLQANSQHGALRWQQSAVEALQHAAEVSA